MPIYDQSFRRYTGPRNLTALWWPVALYTWRPILRRKLVWVLLAMLVLYLGGLSVAFVVSAKVAQHLGDKNTHDAMRSVRREGLPIFDANISVGTILYFIMQPLKALLWLLVLIAGSGVISSDRRFNALPLYFSRPLRPWQYTVGKIGGVAIIPLAAMLLTQWIIGLQFIAYYLPVSALVTRLPVFLLGAVYALLLSGFLATAMTSISSMAKSSRIAGVAFLCFFVLLEKVVPLIALNSDFPALLSLSPLHSLDVIGRTLLRPDMGNIKSGVETGALSVTASVISVIVYLVFFLAVLRKNLRVVEVVK
jgi:ABC-type transport system involved in multi-copper enzyme maturation permease subunit